MQVDHDWTGQGLKLPPEAKNSVRFLKVSDALLIFAPKLIYDRKVAMAQSWRPCLSRIPSISDTKLRDLCITLVAFKIFTVPGSCGMIICSYDGTNNNVPRNASTWNRAYRCHVYYLALSS